MIDHHLDDTAASVDAWHVTLSETPLVPIAKCNTLTSYFRHQTYYQGVTLKTTTLIAVLID